MSNNNSPPATPPSPQRRRSSIADFFSSGFSNSSSNNQNNGTPALPSTIASAAQAQAQQNRRRVSINTMGMSGSSPTNSSTFGAFGRRRASVSSSNSSGSPALEEAVVEENENPVPTNTPASPFARRVSFGAQAYRDIRSGSVSGNNGNNNGTGRPSLATLAEITNQSTSSRSPPTTTPSKSRGLSLATSPLHYASFSQLPFARMTNSSMFANPFSCPTGEGFNWSESMRDKANRPPSMSFGSSPSSAGNQHQRSNTVAVMEPPKEMPPAPKQQKPDVLGERMLRGDFMMD